MRGAHVVEWFFYWCCVWMVMFIIWLFVAPLPKMLPLFYANFEQMTDR